ncbi:MAG: hypothetical protein M0035_10845 [Actinomycetota bacterium]|nr:hypothetical protein [Actinomycetota bacterium]
MAMVRDVVTIQGDADPGPKPLGSPVLILGAGFSKAVHQALPITDELGERVRVRLSRRDREKLPRGRFRGGRFEEWLSYLAEDQPHLAEDRAFEDQALLRRVTQAVRDVLSEAQADALRSGGPGWLFELLSVLCISRATVISLNYDNLVECGVATGHWRSTTNVAAPTSYLGITEDDVLDQLPRLADLARLGEIEDNVRWLPRRAAFENGPSPYRRPEPVASFRLLKLHGSLSWYGVRGDSTGSTLQRWHLPGTFGDPQPDNEEERSRALPAGEPFIVPPAALKSEYLRNPLVRELWRKAYRALMEASRVVLVGYSLPVADLGMAGMVAEALSREQRAVTVEVVNLRPGPVAERLRRLGVPNKAITRIGGKTCVREWAEAERNRLALGAVRRLRAAQGVTGDELLFVLLDGQRGVARVALEGASGDVVVEMAPEGTPLHQTETTKVLFELLREASRIAVEANGRRFVVIEVEGPRKGGAGPEVCLVPAGRFPNSPES